MNKVYTRINWENYPSEKTAVNEANLNKMDSALNEIDTRVVQHETTKANVASLNNLIDDWVIDETTGVITIHKVSGEQIIFDLNLEKVPVGFSMTDDGILIMTTDDGTEFTANIGSMIPILTFNDSDQIAVSVSGEGVNKTYTFTIKTGSIGEDKLQPNFLADCRLYAGNAEESANRAEEYAQQAKESAESVSNNASDILFDDTTAQTGSDNVQGAIEKNSEDIKTKASKDWTHLLNTGYLPVSTSWSEFTVLDLNQFSEINLIYKLYGNVQFTIVLPMEEFKTQYSDDRRTLFNEGKFEVKYVSNTSIAFKNNSDATSIQFAVYAR